MLESFLKLEVLRAGFCWLLNFKDDVDVLCLVRLLVMLVDHLFLYQLLLVLRGRVVIEEQDLLLFGLDVLGLVHIDDAIVGNHSGHLYFGVL